MTALAEKLLPIIFLAFAGYLFDRSKALDSGQGARGISNVAFYRFAPTVAAMTVLCAALPVGANPLLFARRYNVAERETTAAIVISTVAYGGR